MSVRFSLVQIHWHLIFTWPKVVVIGFFFLISSLFIFSTHFSLCVVLSGNLFSFISPVLLPHNSGGSHCHLIPPFAPLTHNINKWIYMHTYAHSICTLYRCTQIHFYLLLILFVTLFRPTFQTHSSHEQEIQIQTHTHINLTMIFRWCWFLSVFYLFSSFICIIFDSFSIILIVKLMTQ